jgi:hypothetical protein
VRAVGAEFDLPISDLVMADEWDGISLAIPSPFSCPITVGKNPLETEVPKAGMKGWSL